MKIKYNVDYDWQLKIFYVPSVFLMFFKRDIKLNRYFVPYELNAIINRVISSVVKRDFSSLVQISDTF